MSPQPLAVCWGMGQDSTGMLVGMWERGIKPQLVITADVGSERPETYAFRPIFDEWLESVGFPRSVAVRYQPQDYKHWPPYYTLLENCLLCRARHKETLCRVTDYAEWEPDNP